MGKSSENHGTSVHLKLRKSPVSLEVVVSFKDGDGSQAIDEIGACIQKRAAAGGPNHVGGAKLTWLVMGVRNMERGGSIDIPHKYP